MKTRDRSLQQKSNREVRQEKTIRYNDRVQPYLSAMKNVKTPCIGICSTTSLGDRVCRGCKRYAIEVIDWNSYDDRAKSAVLARIEKLNHQILQARFSITAPNRLRDGLRRLRIPCNPQQSPYCWLHNLLKKGLEDIDDLHDFGVRLLPEYVNQDLRELSIQIEEELLRLAEAHFERYIAPIQPIAAKSMP